MIEVVQMPNALLVHQETEDGAPEPSILITPYDGNPGIDITQGGRGPGSIFVLTEGVDDLIRALRRALREQKQRLEKGR